MALQLQNRKGLESRFSDSGCDVCVVRWYLRVCGLGFGDSLPYCYMLYYIILYCIASSGASMFCV